jgi:hypothetical protein
MHRRRSLRPALLLAATLLLVLTITAAIAVGSGLIKPPWLDRLSIPIPSQTPSTNPSLPRSTGVWIPTGTMRTPRSGFTAVRLLDGRVLVVGGSTTPESYLTSAELYDPASGTWSATGNTVSGASLDTATLLRDGKVLVVGGSRAQLYDPASGTWSATGKPPSGDGHAAATLLRDGRVLVVGVGEGGAELYDPDSGTWTATGRMITPRYNTTATLLLDGRVLVAGGDVGDVATDSAELYDPETGSWTATASLQATANTRFDIITATLLQDGTVLVVRPVSAALYDPATGTSAATGDLVGTRLGRYGEGAGSYTVTRLLDGTVLLAGGLLADAAAAEVYDPATRSWSTTAPMLRSHGTPAILLLDGTVLVAGGRDCLEGACVATGSAELYVPAGVSPPPLSAFPSPPPPVFPGPTPIPTPFPPVAGPVPAGARSWKVTAVNKSSEPVTLFLAEEDENGMGQLCGNVTPNVVPAGVTEKVTFLLPPKTVKSCWIWVNPPPGGELFQTSDAPLAGEIFIQAGGPVGWVGP